MLTSRGAGQRPGVPVHTPLPHIAHPRPAGTLPTVLDNRPRIRGARRFGYDAARRWLAAGILAGALAAAVVAGCGKRESRQEPGTTGSRPEGAPRLEPGAPPAVARGDEVGRDSGRKRGHGNHLENEKSPFLRQHAHNPIDWYPWGDEAFAKARREDKPIFLSIGYSTCHWCHVMARESFENEDVARLLNTNFVCIQVDREERPDVDRTYMAFVQALTGGGGWPLNVFLTPDLRPFYGGTYFPPDRRGGRPGFIEVLHAVSERWKSH